MAGLGLGMEYADKMSGGYFHFMMIDESLSIWTILAMFGLLVGIRKCNVD